ncbi:MAG TPA: hypothetical protein VHF89_12485 [Solirubrobacteraceae bacterium]|nr:hypothetical protein [Solirubrobacteraceae bacterium]
MDARLVRAGTYTVIAVSMAVAVGAAGFVAGRGTADVDGAFEQGWTAGEAGARRAANERYGEGGAGRQAIAQAAYARGRADGVRAGRRRGLAAGRREGIRLGEQAVFAGFEGGWEPGRWYAVRIAHGEGMRGYAISARRRLPERRRVTRVAAPVRPASSERR